MSFRRVPAAARSRSPARWRRPIAIALMALGVAVGSCAEVDEDEVGRGEGREAGPPDAELAAVTPGTAPGGTAGAGGPDAEAPPRGAGAAGAPGPSAAAEGAPPWLSPTPDCPPSETTIYVTGLMLDMSTGEAKCERSVVVCGDSMTSERRYDSNTERCPWSSDGRTAIAFSEPGLPVCCRDWEEAKRSRTPCDPQLDADCDGIPNDEDLEPLTPAPPA